MRLLNWGYAVPRERSPQNMTLVTLADERYAMPLAVLGRSLSQNMRPGCRATLYVIDGGITKQTKLHLKASWNPGRMHVEFVPPQFGQEQELPVWGRFPTLTYARVFVPFLLPEDCDKAILLDSDVVVLRDIERLWNADLGNHSVLAVQDPAISLISSAGGLASYAALNIPPGQPYFNAGVMVINVRKWRLNDVSRRVMEFIHGHAHELNYCDQDGLNAILWDDWGALDSRWQVQPRLITSNRLAPSHLDDAERAQLIADPWIFHFSGRLKPWLYRGSTWPDRIFYQYLDETWWSGWRPRFSLQACMYRLYDSPLRAWCYPVERWGQTVIRRLSRRSTGV